MLDYVYFDSSGLAKLILTKEQGADVAEALRRNARAIYTSWLSYPEAHSAIARAHRSERLTDDEFVEARDKLDDLWRSFILIEMSPRIARLAGMLASRYPLSGADAMQLASALMVRGSRPMTFASWDRRQLDAAKALNVLVQQSRP